ncbi:MAG: 50S ribosomal protein L23 [Planctomycetia bacterium]|nr:50S ribosomal protein L23 [Planctomycetia bacterium]
MQIREAIENFFHVKVDDVRSMVRKRQSKRVKFRLGKTKDWKRLLSR